MAKNRAILFTSTCSLALAGCSTVGGGTLGGAIGAVAGGALCAMVGGSTEQCVAAAVVSGAVGYGIGRKIDRRDREAYNRSIQRALAYKPEQFKPVTEVSRETGNRITVTSISNTSRPSRPNCRQMQIDYDQQGQSLNSGSETWCLNSEGRYEPVQ
jgi:surface antigen